MEMKQQFFKHTSVNRTFFIMVLIAALLTGLIAPAKVRHSGAASPFIILSSYQKQQIIYANQLTHSILTGTRSV